jgi:methyl-accepting chemotaxis protein
LVKEIRRLAGKFKAAVKKIGNSVADVQRELVSSYNGMGSSQTNSEGPIRVLSHEPALNRSRILGDR